MSLLPPAIRSRELIRSSARLCNRALWRPRLELEAYMNGLFAVIMQHQAIDLSQAHHVSMDASQATLDVEPRLKHIEPYGHAYELLGRYVRYRHAKKVHFQDVADYSESLSPPENKVLTCNHQAYRLILHPLV